MDALINFVKTESKVLKEDNVNGYAHLVQIVQFFLKFQGIDNLNQALTIIRIYDMDKFSKEEKKKINDLSKKIEQIKDDILFSRSSS